MSTRQSRKAPSGGVEAAPADAQPAPEVAPEETRWRTEPWHSHQVLHCLACPFSTLDEPRMEEHVNHSHTRRSDAAHTVQE